MPIFRVKSVKIYTCQKKFTRIYLWRSWQISGMVSWCYWGRGELEPPRTVMPLLPLVPTLLLPPSPSSVKYFRLNPLQPRFLVCMRRRTESFDVAALSQRKLGSFRFFAISWTKLRKAKIEEKKSLFGGDSVKESSCSSCQREWAGLCLVYANIRTSRLGRYPPLVNRGSVGFYQENR